jgi:HAE1 family hydrophobic/amphiphilic exporter-1
MVPLLAVIITKEHKNRLEELQEEYFEKIQAWYKKFLGRMLDSRKTQNRFLALMIVGFFISLSFPIIGIVKVSFFPQDDQDFIYVEIEKPQGTPLAITDLSTREVEEFLYNYGPVSSFVTTVGAGSSFNESGGGRNTKIANITVLLDKERDKTSTEIVDDLRIKLAPIKSAGIKVAQGNNGPPSSDPVVIQFLGDDLNELTLAASKAEKLLNDIPGTLDVVTTLRNDGTQFRITIDRTKAAQAGLSAARVAQLLRTAVSGATATTIKKQSEDIDVLVKLDLNAAFVNPEDTNKTTIDSIKQIPIATPQGTVIMGSLISVSVEESRAVISHEDQKRVATVSSKLKTGVTALEVTNAFQAQIDSLQLPASVRVDFGGENEDVNKTFSEMGFALLAGALLALAILVVEFNSFRFTLYLLSIIPLSFIGVFLGLALSRQALSFSSMLGVIALAGVIINHAIILLDSILHTLHKEGDMSLRNVVIEASAVRLRPIFLTTITTVIGMIPLTTASALWGPLAFTIMFGLAFAMILTLVFIPVLFYRWPGKEFAHRTAPKAPETLVGLSGWLIPLILGLCITWITILIKTYKMTVLLTQSFSSGVFVDLMISVILLSWITYLFYLFLKRKKRFPSMFIRYASFSTIIAGIGLMIILLFPSLLGEETTKSSAPSLFIILLSYVTYGAIWITYIKRSRRVKNTFTC